MTITVKSEETLNTFKFWGQAQRNADKLTYNELGRLTDILALSYDEAIDATELNDLMAYEFGYVCKLLGLDEDEVDARAD